MHHPWHHHQRNPQCNSPSSGSARHRACCLLRVCFQHALLRAPRPSLRTLLLMSATGRSLPIFPRPVINEADCGSLPPSSCADTHSPSRGTTSHEPRGFACRVWLFGGSRWHRSRRCRVLVSTTDTTWSSDRSVCCSRAAHTRTTSPTGSPPRAARSRRPTAPVTGGEGVTNRASANGALPTLRGCQRCARRGSAERLSCTRRRP